MRRVSIPSRIACILISLVARRARIMSRIVAEIGMTS
jgi:hypothetical protein